MTSDAYLPLQMDIKYEYQNINLILLPLFLAADDTGYENLIEAVLLARENTFHFPTDTLQISFLPRSHFNK